MRKTVYRLFSYAECDELALYLETMSRKGWHLVAWERGLVFEKGEPQEIQYVAAVVAEDKRIWDKNSDKILWEEKEFAEYCEIAGWQVVARRANICIFRKKNEEAVPILTETERFIHIWKKSMWERLGYLGTTLIVFLLLGMDIFTDNPNVWLFQDAMIFVPILLMAGILFELCSFGNLWIWKKSIQRKIEQGETLSFRRKQNRLLISDRCQLLAGILWKFFIVVVLLYCRQYEAAIKVGAAFLLIVAEQIMIDRILWKDVTKTPFFRVSVLAIVLFMGLETSFVSPVSMQEEQMISKSDCPLVQEDYREIKYVFEEAVYQEVNSNAGSIKRYDITYCNPKQTANPMNQEDHIFYVIYESKNDWVLDRVFRYYAKYLPNELEDLSEEWGAEKAISAESYISIIKYEDKVLYLGETADLTQEQIEIIRDKLDLR